MNYKSFLQNKKKKKRRILKFKELCFPDTLSEKFQRIALKFATLYLFYPFFFLFLLNKIPFKTLLSVLSFRISIWTRKPRNFLFKLTVWTYRLILHTKAI